MRHLIPLGFVLAFLGACDLTGTHFRTQRAGLLRLALEDSINFVAPDTVNVNTNFDISVSSFGGGCDTKGPTDVIRLSNGAIEFRPYDVTEDDGETACVSEIRTFVHTGTLQFPATGDNSITLWGRDWNGALTSRTKNVFVK